MPLVDDGEYRGTRAIHVRRHRKLGKHRTLIKRALPLVNWLIAQPEVRTVNFLKVATASGQAFTVRAECTVAGTKITMLLVSVDSAQAFEVFVRSAKEAEAIKEYIVLSWPRMQAANDD